MVKRCLAILLVATLLLAAAPAALAKGGPNFSKAKDLKFEDWNDAPWALEHMVMMRARGIIQGYANGKFKPNSAISQAEALAMVIRMKGDTAEQAAQAMNPTTAVPGIAAAWWARGYVAYALQQGWIDSTFQPNAAAKRAWVARLMVKALVDGWQAQVAANANAVLQFKDANEIKAEDRPYVAIVVARGWMNGYTNGKFQPNKPITRAEMAALLDRGYAIVPGSHPYEVKGVVESVDAINHRIRVFADQQSREFTVSVDALIFLENQTVTLADLRQGDKVEMMLNASQIVLVIKAERDEHGDDWYSYLSGTVVAFNFSTSPRYITLQPSGYHASQQTTTYTLADDCKAKYLGYEVVLSTVVLGDKVRLELDGAGKVKVIQITEKAGSAPVGSEIIGTIAEVQVYGGGVSIRIQGYSTLYPIAAGATITPSMTPSALQAGWIVRATITSGYITALQIIDQGTATTVQGTVVSTNTSTTPKTITLIVSGSPSSTVQTFNLATTCTAYYLGAAIALDTIRPADTAILSRESGGTVTSIVLTARGPQTSYETSGTLEVLEVSSSGYRLVVRDSSSVLHDHWLATSAMVRAGTTTLTAADLQTGMLVHITVVNSKITVLDITATTVAGVVNATGFSTTPKTITVTPTAGTATVYTLAAVCKAYVGSTEVALATVNQNDEVQMLIYSGINKVGKITITKDILQGRVTGITVDSTGTRVTIDAAGTAYAYYLASGVTLPAGIVVGFTVVQITVVSNQITVITIVP